MDFECERIVIWEQTFLTGYYSKARVQTQQFLIPRIIKEYLNLILNDL